MGEWEPLHLHWGFNGEHVLLPFIVLKSFPSFILACIFLIALCATERIITHYHEGEHALNSSSSRWKTALQRCLLYWIAMVLRLFYMLATMTFNIPIILVIATALALTQLFLDLHSHSKASHVHFTALGSETPTYDSHHYAHQTIPTSPASTFVALESVTPKHSNTAVPSASGHTVSTGRPRSKSKPDLDIFIHPAESNIARADALAMQLGIASDTERVHIAAPGSAKWEAGKGPDVAKQLLLSKTRARTTSSSGMRMAGQNLHQRTGSFQIGNDTSSEEESEDESDGEVAETRNFVR